MDVALDDRAAGVSIAQVKQAVDAGQAVTRSQKFQVLAGSSLRAGTSTGDTLYFGSRESQTMLRVYDKRLELEQKGREEAKDYGVRWELELKKDRAQACAKALLTLPPEDWREFLVGDSPLVRGFPRDHPRRGTLGEVSGAAARVVGLVDRRLQTLPAGRGEGPADAR